MLKYLLTLLSPLLATCVIAQVTDTLGWHTFHGGTTELYLSPNGGYAFGNNGYGDRVKAQSFWHPESYVLRGALLRFGAVVNSSGDPASAIRVSVYNNAGSGIGLYGVMENLAPDSVLAYKDIPVSELPMDGSYFEVDLSDSSIVVFDRLSIGIDLTYLAVGDSVGLYSTTDGDAEQDQEAWEQDADGDWFTVVSPYSWGLDVDLAIFALIDVNDPAGIDEHHSDVTLWPNPTSGPITVSLPQSGPWQVDILSADGRTVHRNMTFSEQFTMNLSNLARGVYLMRIAGNGTGFASRLIIQ